MAIKVYVRRDEEGRELPAVHSHEAMAALNIIQKLWLAYNHLQEVIGVGLSLEYPSADMLIITPHGTGVLELKDDRGQITGRPEQSWTAKRWFGLPPKMIQAGRQSGNARLNPQEQVRDYAEMIKKKVERYDPILSHLSVGRGGLCFDTAVCFTDLRADISKLKENYAAYKRHDWEKFCILTPDEAPGWVYGIRFEEKVTAPEKWKRRGQHLLSNQLIDQMMTDLFKLTVSEDIPKLMPQGHPYAYLSLLANGRPSQLFGLYRDNVLIGRDPAQCNILVPDSFENVSRTHTELLRRLDGVYLRDKGSKNGTFVNNKRVEIEEPHLLKNGDKITLGIPGLGGKVCELKFTQEPPTGFSPAKTTIQQMNLP